MSNTNVCDVRCYQSLSYPPRRETAVYKTAGKVFFPYYAGYSESFAKDILHSAGLEPNSVVLDPWNGSGTTIYTAREFNYSAIGIDINPAMVVIAKARMLPPTEADSLEPLSRDLLARTYWKLSIDASDPLLCWFQLDAARRIREIERSICSALVGRFTIREEGVQIDSLSCLACAYCCSLFGL